MRPGELKRRVEIRRPTTVTDDTGGQTVTYTSLGFFYASVSRIGGSRGLEYQQTLNSRGFSITLRQNIDILENDIVFFENMELIVNVVDRDWDRFKYQTLTATAKYV